LLFGESLLSENEQEKRLGAAKLRRTLLEHKTFSA